MSGSTSHVGGVDAGIALQAGRGVQNNNLMAQSPHEFANTLSSYNQLSLFPLKRQELEQQLELQRLGVQRGNVGLQSEQLGLTQSQNLAATRYLMPLLGAENVSFDQIMSGLGAAENHNVPAARQIEFLKHVTPPKDGNWAPILRQMVIPGLSEGGALQVLTPRMQTIAAGGSTVAGVETPLGVGGKPGSFTPQQVITSTVAPEYRANPQTRTEGANPPVTAPGQTFAPPETLTPSITPIGPGSVPTGPPAVVPGAAAPEPAAGATGVPGAGGAPTTGLPLGAATPIEASGQQYAEAQKAASTFGARVLPLRQAIDLLSDTETGPGSQTANQFRSFLISMANQGLLPKSITPNAINQAKFDELRKYMSNYITNIPFAAGSDAKMAEAISGNPNVELSSLANRDLARVMVGVERFRQAQYLGFTQAAEAGAFGERAKTDPNYAAQHYGNWAAKFNTQYDIRAFGVDLMGGFQSPAVKKLYASLPDDKAKQRFVSSMKFAYGVNGLME